MRATRTCNRAAGSAKAGKNGKRERAKTARRIDLAVATGSHYGSSDKPTTA